MCLHASRIYRQNWGAHRVAGAQEIRLKAKLTHQEMANLIGCSRETVSGMLGQFRDEGLIQMDGRTIVILKLEALARRAA